MECKAFSEKGIIMALNEATLGIESYIEEFVEANSEMLLAVLDSCVAGTKVRDISEVADFDNEMVMC